MHPEAASWQSRGHAHSASSKFFKGIECYDEALKRVKSSADAVILLLDRSSARVNFQAFDAALQDAKAAMTIPPGNKPPSGENERALYLASRALYGLRRFRENHEHLQKLISFYPNTSNEQVKADIKKCEVRLREESGQYDFAAMLQEARSCTPYMDRATYVGPIEVRPCFDPSHGRGLFTTDDVEAGDLLLCEKAFSAVFAKSSGQKNGGNHVEKTIVRADAATKQTDEQVDEEIWALRAELATKVFVKLIRNPSLQAGFADLYPGPDVDEEVDKDSNVTITDDSVQQRMIYNAFGFPRLSHRYHYHAAHNPETLADNSSRGIWLRASHINHSCYPLVRRSFIGDIMIFRAQADIPANTELKFGYISCLEDYMTRQGMLAKYGFSCECCVCMAERETSNKKVKKREKVMREIINLFEADEAVGLHTYLEKLGALESTYSAPPTQQPRQAIVMPIVNIVNACKSGNLHSQVIHLVHRLLQGLGFEILVTEESFTVLRWGFLVDEIVLALVDLCKAYGTLKMDEISEDVEGVARMCYLIMCGEDASWEGAYGKDRLETGGKVGELATEEKGEAKL